MLYLHWSSAFEEKKCVLLFIFLGGVPKIRRTFLGAPIKRIVAYQCLYWGPLVWETTISMD